MRYASLLCLLALGASSGTTLAQTTVPHTFASGTAARASEVNANFQALATAIDNLAARVSKLENGPTADADIVGTYSLSSMQIGVGQVLPQQRPDMEVISYDGTITFAADHTLTSTFRGRTNDANGPSPDDGTLTGTWSLTGNKLTAIVNNGEGESTLPFSCTAGCRVGVAVHYGASSGVGDEGLNNLMIIVKDN